MDNRDGSRYQTNKSKSHLRAIWILTWSVTGLLAFATVVFLLNT